MILIPLIDMPFNFKVSYINRDIKLVLLVFLFLFVLPMSKFLFLETELYTENLSKVEREIVFINTTDILDKKISQINIKINFTFSDYQLNDNLFQTDIANNGLRLEISPSYAMNLIQFTKENGFNVINLIEKLEIGQTYDFTVIIDRKSVHALLVNENKDIYNEQIKEDYNFPSIKNIMIGAGFNEQRAFHGIINYYSVELKSLPTYFAYFIYFAYLMSGLFGLLLIYNNFKKIHSFLNTIQIDKLVTYFLICCIFIIGFFMRFELYNIPFSGVDTIGYLGVALQYFEHDFFGQIADRSYPYPLFLTFILSLSHSVTIVPIIQHILGLLAGALFLKVWLDLNFLFLKLKGNLHRFYWMMGILGLCAILCSNWSVMIEHHTHPEALTTFLIVVLIFIYLKFYKICTEKASSILTVLYGIGFFLINYLLFLYQPRYGLNIISMIILFLVTLFVNLTFKRSIFIVLGSVIFTWFLLIAPFSSFSYKQKSNVNLEASLFFHNLKTIAPLIQYDIEKKKIEVTERDLLETIIFDFNLAKNLNNNYGSGFNKSLGLNTDSFDKTTHRILNYFKGDYVKTRFFYAKYLGQAILSDPLGLISKIINEFIYFYTDDVMFINQLSSTTMWEYSFATISGFKPHFPKTVILTDYINGLDFVRTVDNYEAFSYLYNIIYKIDSFLKSILAAVTIMFLVILGLSIKFKTQYYQFGIFTFLTLILQLGFNLTISIVNTNSVQRYIDDQLAIIIIFEMLAITFIVINTVDLITKKLYSSNILNEQKVKILKDETNS